MGIYVEIIIKYKGHMYIYSCLFKHLVKLSLISLQMLNKLGIQWQECDKAIIAKYTIYIIICE